MPWIVKLRVGRPDLSSLVWLPRMGNGLRIRSATNSRYRRLQDPHSTVRILYFFVDLVRVVFPGQIVALFVLCGSYGYRYRTVVGSCARADQGLCTRSAQF